VKLAPEIHFESAKGKRKQVLKYYSCQVACLARQRTIGGEVCSKQIHGMVLHHTL